MLDDDLKTSRSPGGLAVEKGDGAQSADGRHGAEC